MSGRQAPHQYHQYHVQTDQGDSRFFRFQTHSGQFRKETLHPDGSQEGSYGWVDPTGVLRLFHYIADKKGYRITKESHLQLDGDVREEIHEVHEQPAPKRRLGNY